MLIAQWRVKSTMWEWWPINQDSIDYIVSPWICPQIGLTGLHPENTCLQINFVLICGQPPIECSSPLAVCHISKGLCHNMIFENLRIKGERYILFNNLIIKENECVGSTYSACVYAKSTDYIIDYLNDILCHSINRDAFKCLSEG